MKNNILTHKIIPILAIFILCFFSIFVTNVNAATDSSNIYNTNIPENVINVITNSEYFNNNYYCLGVRAAGGSVRGNYYVFFVQKTDTLKATIDSSSSWSFNEDCYHFSYNFDSSGNLTEIGSSSTSALSSSRYFNNDLYGDVLLLGNGDFYKTDGSVFFQPPPLTLTQTLVEETTKTQVTEQLKAMIAGFLKSLMLLVISVIAFWKAWVFLKKILKKA